MSNWRSRQHFLRNIYLDCQVLIVVCRIFDLDVTCGIQVPDETQAPSIGSAES